MAFPSAALVAITDTNALAARACNAASCSRAEDLFTGLADTGRSNTYVSAHVPGELDDHLADVAAHYDGLSLADAERVLWRQMMPNVPVIDLAVGDYLHPRARPLMRADPDLPRRLRGDVDDIGTAALAEFLAPTVIISADSVFSRFGLANTVATTWLPVAHQLLRAAGFEATMTDTAALLELAGRVLLGAGSAAARAARQYPLLALALLAGAAWLAWRGGYLRRDQWKATGRQLAETATTWMGSLSDAFAGYELARGALLVIESYGPPTVEQLAARHLARLGHSMPVDLLAGALTQGGYTITPQELEEAVRRHPAFHGDPRSPLGIQIGRPARSRHEARLEPSGHSAWRHSVPDR
jgi:hypothetical protein